MAGDTGNNGLDRRNSRRDEERRLAASRHAERSNTLCVHSRMSAQPADGLLEVLERDFCEKLRGRPSIAKDARPIVTNPDAASGSPNMFAVAMPPSDPLRTITAGRRPLSRGNMERRDEAAVDHLRDLADVTTIIARGRMAR